MPINQYAVLYQIITNRYAVLYQIDNNKSNPPNNIKVNPLINFFKMPINLNSLEKTAETQISRQKSSINLYAVLFLIIKKKPFYKLLQNAD